MKSPKCDPVPKEQPPSGKPSSIGDPEWGMWVVADDPARNTPEKARAYYEKVIPMADRAAAERVRLLAKRRPATNLAAARA